MIPPEDLLFCYDDLSPEEQARADAYLAKHPEAHRHLAEGRRLRALLRSTSPPDSLKTAEEAMAALLAARHVAGPERSADLDREERRLLDLAEDHPELAERYAAQAERLEEIVEATTPPLEHFEALTGYRIGAPSAAKRSRTSPPQTQSQQPDRGRRPQTRRSSPWRLIVFFIVGFAGLYGGAFVASEASQPSHQQLADLGEAPNVYQGLRLRGSDGEVDLVADRYAAGREALLEARTSVLGLFPHYDSDRLDQALEAFEEAVAFDAANGPLGLEARYMAGRIYLHRGDVDAARQAFEVVVTRGGPSAPEARQLLEAMDEQAL